MMLPGVELARKRRIHHHGGGRESLFSPRGHAPASPLPRAERRGAAPASSMAEPALVARRRLEEKLRGFGFGSAAPHHLPTFSWRNPPAGEPGGPPRRAPPATSGANYATRTAEKPPVAASARMPALERVDSASAPDECAVCLEGFRGEGRQVLDLPCSHRYHRDCVLPWLAAHPHCPCCRSPVPS
uniref:E3 ubiquitin-protein ligase RING1 n=1 Tax=Anthurium amnicola TaxID=1678845 RepID=A0A1D1Z6M7_9ARAE